MKYELNIEERIALLNVLPFQGDVVTLKIIRDLQNSLSFSEEEMKRFKMKNIRKADGSTFAIWDSDFTNETKTIEIGEVAEGIIVGQLKLLESKKMLRMEMLTLYEKFVPKSAELKPS